MSQSHHCSACGGSGQVGTLKQFNYGTTHDCPVCLGDGRINDKIPARDAVNDTETFLAVLFDRGLPIMREWAQVRHATFEAERMAWHGLIVEPWAVGEWLGKAAHYAFKAVPGLRGDR